MTSGWKIAVKMRLGYAISINIRANFQSVTLEKFYPSSAIKKAAIFLVHEPNSELISMACLHCDH